MEWWADCENKQANRAPSGCCRLTTPSKPDYESYQAAGMPLSSVHPVICTVNWSWHPRQLAPVVEKSRPWSMFCKDAPFTKPQEKTCGLSALPWRPNSTAASRSWRRRRHSSPERPWSCRLRTPRRRRSVHPVTQSMHQTGEWSDNNDIENNQIWTYHHQHQRDSGTDADLLVTTTRLVGREVRRPLRQRQSWVRFELSSWIFFQVVSYHSLKNGYSSVYPARRLVLEGRLWGWLSRCQCTVTGWDRKFDLQLLPQCGSTHNCPSRSVPEIHKHVAGWLVGWLLNVPATCECISGTDLLGQLYVLPHWDRTCRQNFLPHPITVCWHRAEQSQHWPYNAKRLAG